MPIRPDCRHRRSSRLASPGRGAAQALLAGLETQVRALGLRALYLETGELQPAAIVFQRRAGFTGISAFGAYRPDPNRLFMVRFLTEEEV